MEKGWPVESGLEKSGFYGWLKADCQSGGCNWWRYLWASDEKSQPHGLTFLFRKSPDYLEAAGAAGAEAAGAEAAGAEAAGAEAAGAEAAGASEPEAAGAEAAGAEADAAAEPEAAGFLPHAVRARASRPATNRVFFILNP